MNPLRHPPIGADPVQAGARPWPDGGWLRTAARCWIALAAALYVQDLWRQTAAGLTDGAGRPFGDDFINYWSAAALAWQGRAAEIYDMQAFHAFQTALVGAPIEFYHYSYPPVLFLLTLPLAALPYVPALAFWLLTGWYAFYRALRLALPHGALLLALAAPAVFVNAMGGQNGVWTAALLGGGLCLLNRKPAVAGILFGLLIYKPHLGLLIPVALLAGGHWRAFAAAAATTAALLAASVLVFGVEIWGDYLRNAALLREVILEDGTGVWHRMVSVFVAARRLGAGIEHAYAIQAATALIAASVVALAWARHAPENVRNSLLVLGTCLTTPYLMDYDLVVCAFVAVWLSAEAGAARRFGRAAFVVSAQILVLPLAAAPLGKLTGLALGPLFLIPAFVLAAAFALRKRA